MVDLGEGEAPGVGAGQGKVLEKATCSPHRLRTERDGADLYRHRNPGRQKAFTRASMAQIPIPGNM
ncbi:hypothetical protein [Nocardia wallacei]|uniref:hypothetical protein n=1 Tax=Nocardia wallacei TaxID=480035 RepID=UPI002458AE79|nr:hypothetical protein [Nocardia wallacei]